MPKQVAKSQVDTTIEETDDLFEMANLHPKSTGLPMTVWVSSGSGVRHDVRVKVDTAQGKRTAVVGVRPTPRLIAGALSGKDEAAVLEWVRLNTQTLVAYWNEEIDTADLIARLRRIGDEAPEAGTGPAKR